MDEQLKNLIEGAKKQGATDNDIKKIIDMYIADQKKKESSEPTSQEGAGVSPTRTTQQGTSSDTEPPMGTQVSVTSGGQTGSPFQSIDPFGGKGAVGAIVSEQQKTQQPSESYAVQVFKKSKSEVDENITEERLLEEKNQSGILNNLGKAAKAIWNVTGTGLSSVNEALGGTKDYFVIDEYKPLQDEKIQAKRELEKEGLPITGDNIQKRAEDIFRINDKRKQLEKRIDANLPEDYDRQGIWKELKLDNLKKNSSLKEAFISADIYQSQIKEFESYYNSLKNIPREQITQAQVDKYNELLGNANESLEGLKYLDQKFPKILEEVKSSDELLDVFKYNYNDYEKHLSNIKNFAKGIAGGTVKLMEETARYLDEKTGLDTDVYGFREGNIKMANEVIDEASEDRQQYLRYNAKDISNFSDVGSFMAGLGTEQLPVVVTLAIAPEIGLPLIGAGTGGEQFRTMEIEESQPFAQKTTFGQKLATAYMYGGAEALFERLGTVSVLKNIRRSIAGTPNNLRRLIQDGSMQEVSKLGKQFGYNFGLEGGTEYLTAEAQIAADRYIAGKEISTQQANERRFESSVAGGIMGGGMTIIGGVWGGIAQKARIYSDNKDIKKTREILSQIERLSDEIKNNPNLTQEERVVIYKKMNELTNQSFDIVSKNENKDKDFNAQETQFLVDINIKQAELKAKLQEIKDSNFSKEQKQTFINELKDEYSKLEEKRNTTLQGGYNKLTELPSAEVIRLKDKAARELMKELNPDGTKTITINDSEITKRAIQLLESETKAPVVEEMSVNAPAAEVNEEKIESVRSNFENGNLQNIEITPTREGFDGDFLNDYEFLAEGSEHTVYRSKDGKTVIKIGEPYGSNEGFMPRVEDALRINNLIGDNSLEVIGFYESNGVMNPVYQQNYIDGNIMTQEEVASHLESKGFVNLGNNKFAITVNGKTYEISDTSDNFIIDNQGNVSAIDAGIIELDVNKLTEEQKSKLKKPAVAPTEAKVEEVKPAEALKDVESTANALMNRGYNENEIKIYREAQNLIPEDTKGEMPSERLSEAYHKAKAEGTNPELVKAVEELLAPEVATTETTTEVAPTEATATEDIAPSNIETTLDEVITPASSNIKEQIARAKKAISKFLPNVEIVYHTTAESFQSVVGDNSRGYYDPNTKKIHINGSNANSRTVSHEVFHAVVLKYITSDKQATDLTNRMFKALAKSIKGNPKLLEDINKFADNYSKGLQSEEKLAEVLGYLASEYETLPDVSKNIIQKWIEKIAKMVGIKKFTDQEVVDFMNTLATRVSTGQEITEADVEKVVKTRKKISEKQEDRKQISPENSSNYANMTEDGKGNFVFYHFGPRGIKSIDPKKYGSNKGSITSKPEIAAMGRVGGMSQFYTMPEYQESNVSGDKYMIKVPMDKVYDFNTDPENFYDKAKEMFKAKHPDLPFTANDQLAYITKLAEKAGYDMTVAEWNDMSRAQSTKALKPVDTQFMDGNVISKPFQEDYESNSAKGFESVIPTSKEAKLKDVYQKINAERNSKNRYDSLYSLAEDFPKLSQDKITDMIESSDISQEMKDAYAEALAYEPGTRMSGRRQVDAKAIAKNTKAEVDRIKALPINTEDGATFNLDGTKYEGGGLVVPMNSLEGNTTQEKISPDMIGDFAKENENSISDESMVKMGIYKFPDLDTVSIDMNIVIPNEHRAVALEFGALTGQKSLFDLDTFEYVETGGDGLNTMKLTPAQFREAASSLKNGVMPTFVSGRKQKSPIDTAVETAKRKGFNDKEIADYLVGKGYTRAQATNAILRYNNVTAAKLRKEDSVFTKEGRNKIITFLDQVKRRALSAKSFLPKSVFKFKEGIEANIKAEAKRASYLVDDFNKLVKSYKGDVNALNDEFDRYLRGDQTAVLPDEFKVVAGKMRMHIDNLSQMLLRTGAVSVSQAETIAANLGQYINRSYQVFDKKNWAKQVTEEMKEAARVDLRNMYRASAESKAKQTGMDADIILEKFINDKIDELISGEPAATFLGIGKTGSKDLSIMKQRLDIPLSIRQLMGEYTDASQNYARTVIKIATLAENARFLQSARDAGMGVFFFKEGDLNKPSEFNVQIAGEGSETMNPLNGLFTTKEIADAFKTSISAEKFIEGFVGPNVASSVVSLYTNYMKLLSVVKWNKTIASVATHFKNVTGNIWFMLSNGYFNYKKYGEAFNVLKNKKDNELRDKLDEYIRAGIIDQSAALGEIKSMFSDANFETAIENRLKKNPLEKAKKAARWVITKLNTAYQIEDDFYKIVSYESEKDRYSNAEFQKPFDQLTEDQKLMVSDIAAENTKNVLPNYARIPGLVKLIKIAPVTGTFISFQAEAYRTAWNTVALAFDELNSKNKRVKAIGAKRLAGIAFSQSVKFGLMTAIGTVLRGGDDDDEEDKLNKNVREFVPEWSKKSDLVLVEYGNGKFSYVDFSASDPHGGIKKAYNSFMAGDGAVESFTNGMSEIFGPFVKKDMLLEAITDINNNENSYGGKLYNDADTNVNKINAIAERFYKVLEPGSLTSARKIAQAENVGNELAGQLTGYKVITIDVGQQLGFKMNKSKDDIREAKRLYNSAFYKFEDGKMTAEELESNYNQANSAQKEMYKSIMDNMKAASFFGVEDRVIDDAMEGIGKGVVNDLWYGDIPDMKQKQVKLTDAEFRAKYGEKVYNQMLRGRELLKKGAK